MALPTQSGLLNWLFFLRGTDTTNWEVLQMNEPTIKKAMTTLEFLSQDSEARIRYEERQKYLHDEASAMEWAMDNGVEKGKQEGERQKSLEIAKNLLKEGLAIDVISKVTGLSEKEIVSLKPLK
jgi:predicted transposase/invertase (TIGR01784 family)